MPVTEGGEGHAGPAEPAAPAEPAEPGWPQQGGVSAEEWGSSEAGLGSEVGRQPGNEMGAERPVFVSFRETKTERSRQNEPPAFFLVDQYGRETLAVTSVFDGEYTGCKSLKLKLSAHVVLNA